MFQIYKFLAILVVTIQVTACSSIVPLKSPLSQPPLVEKSLIPVVIFYAENLEKHKCIVDKGYIAATWAIEIGPPSVEMFNQIFDAFFEKAVVAGKHSDIVTYDGPKSIIEVRLLSFDGCEARWPIFGTSIEVAYEATLRTMDGVTIARWEGRGKAGPDDDLKNYTDTTSVTEVEAQYLGTVTSIAMRKAAADFIINFDKNTEIRAWLGK